MEQGHVTISGGPSKDSKISLTKLVATVYLGLWFRVLLVVPFTSGCWLLSW